MHSIQYIVPPDVVASSLTRLGQKNEVESKKILSLPSLRNLNLDFYTIEKQVSPVLHTAP